MDNVIEKYKNKVSDMKSTKPQINGKMKIISMIILSDVVKFENKVERAGWNDMGNEKIHKNTFIVKVENVGLDLYDRIRKSKQEDINSKADELFKQLIGD